MIQISTPSPALHFSYAVHPVPPSSEADPAAGFKVHLVIHHLPCASERTPMVLIVEFDYMRLAPGKVPPAISLEVEGLHPEMQLGSIEVRLLAKNASPADPNCDGSDPASPGQTWDFRNAA